MTIHNSRLCPIICELHITYCSCNCIRLKYTQMRQGDEFCSLLAGPSFLRFSVRMERTHFFMFCLYHPWDLRFDSGTSPSSFDARITSFLCKLIIFIVCLKDPWGLFEDLHGSICGSFGISANRWIIYSYANVKFLNYWCIFFFFFSFCCFEKFWNWDAQKYQFFSILFISLGWTYSETVGNQLDLIKPSSKGNVTIYGKTIWALQF